MQSCSNEVENQRVIMMDRREYECHVTIQEDMCLKNLLANESPCSKQTNC